MKKNLILTAAMYLLCLIPLQSADAAGDLFEAARAFKFNEGTLAPEFNLEDIIGNRVALNDFRGKVVLIDFWATW